MDEKPEVIVYTDGACSPNPGPGGWGAVLFWGGREKEISGYEAETTNNRMELTAAVESLAILKFPCRVTINTDSEYIVNAFRQGWLVNWQANGWKTAGNKSVKNDDLWRRLVALNHYHAVTWNWVRGHAGNEVNERCDRLAVAARLSGATKTGNGG